MKRPKCGCIKRRPRRISRCSLAASWVIFSPRGAAIRCEARARSGLYALELNGIKHGKCRMPKAVGS